MEQFFYSNYLLDFGWTNSNASSNSSCPPPLKLCSNDSSEDTMCILNPTLIPPCILALIIGLTCSNKLWKLSGPFPSRWYYSLTFFLFGIMMTSAGILHCLIGDIQQTLTTNDDYTVSIEFMQFFFTVIDVGLTTNIAVSFFFCGLCDIGLLDSKSLLPRCLLVLLYLVVFLLWALGILNNWSWIFKVLYVGVIFVGCSIYFLTQLCLKRTRSALPMLFFAGVYGAIGLYIASYGSERVCESEGAAWAQYIGPEFIWFLFSDIAMAFVYMYVARANSGKKEVDTEEYPVDLEKPPMKY